MYYICVPLHVYMCVRAIYMCVCVYTYIYSHTHTYIYIHIYNYIHINIWVNFYPLQRRFLGPALVICTSRKLARNAVHGSSFTFFPILYSVCRSAIFFWEYTL